MGWWVPSQCGIDSRLQGAQRLCVLFSPYSIVFAATAERTAPWPELDRDALFLAGTKHTYSKDAWAQMRRFRFEMHRIGHLPIFGDTIAADHADTRTHPGGHAVWPQAAAPTRWGSTQYPSVCTLLLHRGDLFSQANALTQFVPRSSLHSSSVHSLTHPVECYSTEPDL